MQINTLLCASLIVILTAPGCAWKGISIKRDIDKINKRSIPLAKTPLCWDCSENSLEGSLLYAHPSTISDRLEQGISCQDAISLALMNNPGLQADFETLGIARADLIRAGLYENPRIDSIFQVPTSCSHDDVTQSFTVVSMNISDLWQVPLRQKISASELEIVSLRVFNQILTLIKDTKCAYARCLYAKALIDYTNNIGGQLDDFIKKIDSQHNDLTHHALQAWKTTYNLERISREYELQTAHLELKRLLGLRIDQGTLRLTDTLFEPNHRMPTIDELMIFAKNHNPDLEIAHWHKQKAEDILRYEKSRIIHNVKAGFSYARTFDRSKGLGGYVGLDVPLFDRNEGVSGGYYFRVRHAEREYQQTLNTITANIHQLHHELKATWRKMESQAELLEHYKKALTKSLEKANDIHLAMETFNKIYQETTGLFNLYYHMMNTQASLEHIAAGTFDMIPVIEPMDTQTTPSIERTLAQLAQLAHSNVL